jgi:hypothetical protein
MKGSCKYMLKKGEMMSTKTALECTGPLSAQGRILVLNSEIAEFTFDAATNEGIPDERISQ